MKVLKRVPWSYTFTCSGCKSELQAERDDVRIGEFGGGYCESGDTRYYVTCAVCGDDHILKQRLPTDVANGAVRKRS